jgi:uncharacterized protein (DUF697 family)
MHDLDRTTAEFEADPELYEADGQELEWEDGYETDESYAGEGVLTEADEMQLAAELLEVADEAELDYFIKKVFRKVGRGLRSFARSGVGRALGRGLRKIGKVALPIAGKAVGGFFGGPAGAAIGGKLGSAATKLFELELEGMSYEDQEFEVARRYVQLAADAAKNAAAAAPNTPPEAAGRVAKNALAKAARRYAPGLLRGGRPAFAGAYGRRGGRWVRRGNRIILFGV